jgi:phytoene dehydrogenase-like protein
MESFDVIIVGGGHNGLIAGAYLQKLGFHVCIIEQNRKIGGGVMSEELTLPGFIHDTGAVTHQRIRNSPLIKDDELGLRRKYGLQYIVPEIPLAALFEDGSSILVHRDLEKTVESISRISKEDAIAYKRFNKWGEKLRDLMNRIANAQEPLEDIDIEFRSFFTRVREYVRLGSCLFKFSPLPLYSLVTGTFMDVIDYWFKNPKVRAFVARMGSKGMVYPDDTATAIPGTIATLGSHTMGGGSPKGGSGAFSDALGRCFVDLGGKIMKSSEVSTVLIENGEAKGVTLKSGAKVRASAAIVSTINIKQLFGQLVQAIELPPNFSSAVRRLKHSSYSSVSVHLALKDPPVFKALETITNVYRIELLSTAEQLIDGFNEIRRGLPPTNPYPTILVPTIYDPSRAPAGRHTLWLYAFAPYELQGLGAKGWDQKKEEVTEGLIKKLNRYAANMVPENILARYTDSPLDLERRNPSFIQGDHEHISHTLSQMAFNRPIPGWSRYRTPIKKLYICGASTHPSGGVTGAARVAVQAIINDLGLKGNLSRHLHKTN